MIKSIVQLCEDIVHVDPLTSNIASLESAPASRPKRGTIRPYDDATEVYASTRFYPSWWSELNETKILRRRKSMGDAVLERNVCFVDIPTSKGTESATQYMQQQLHYSIMSSTTTSGDSIGLLSGRGGAQVDVVLYLITNGTSIRSSRIPRIDMWQKHSKQTASGSSSCRG